MKQFLLAAFLIVVPVVLFSAYQVYAVKTPLAATVPTSPLGDLAQFKTIIADVRAIAAKGDFTAAEKRATDFESAWDDAQAKLRPLNSAAWGEIDDAADATFKALRATALDAPSVTTALAALAAALDSPGQAAGGGAQAAGTALKVEGIAVSDTSGHAIPCEEMIKKLRTAIEGGKIGKGSLDAASALMAKATERCNADDDTLADEFSAYGLAMARE
jgi:hypothetical protein